MIERIFVCSHSSRTAAEFRVGDQRTLVVGCDLCVLAYEPPLPSRYDALRLARSFSSVDAWEGTDRIFQSVAELVEQAADEWDSMGEGAKHAVCLLVEIAGLQSSLPAFRLSQALASWDADDRAVFMQWVTDPWWMPKEVVFADVDEDLIHTPT